MDHVAIMNKKWRLIPKILSGKKTIESRWYKFRRDPWNNVAKGETVYFKNSGEAVSAKAKVFKVEQFEHLDESKIRTILETYSQEIGFEKNKVEENTEFYKGKKYCILMWLEKAEAVSPFEINKSGFGIGAAWISVDKVERIKK